MPEEMLLARVVHLFKKCDLKKMIVQTVFLESTVAMVYNATVFKRDILLLIALIALQMMAVPLQSYVRKVINV